jgi:hypothetical protein
MTISFSISREGGGFLLRAVLIETQNGLVNFKQSLLF